MKSEILQRKNVKFEEIESKYNPKIERLIKKQQESNRKVLVNLSILIFSFLLLIGFLGIGDNKNISKSEFHASSDNVLSDRRQEKHLYNSESLPDSSRHSDNGSVDSVRRSLSDLPKKDMEILASTVGILLSNPTNNLGRSWSNSMTGVSVDLTVKVANYQISTGNCHIVHHKITWPDKVVTYKDLTYCFK